jgi:HD superfamily phosphohydrolase YqeK
MRKPRISKTARAAKTASPLMVRMDNKSKRCLAEAAGLRHITVS